MLDPHVRRLYHRLGPRYSIAFILTSGPAATLVGLGTIAILASFYEPSAGDLALLLGITAVVVFASVMFPLVRSRAEFERVLAWSQIPAPTPAETVAAWDSATNLPMRSFRRDALRVAALSSLPCTLAVVLVLDLEWYAVPVLLVACAIAAGYGTVLNYSMSEYLLRPAIEEIAAALPEDFTFTRNGLPIRKRLIIGLPVFTALTGVIVAALVTESGGTGLLATTVAASLGVGAALSHELGVLLARAITNPIADLRTAMARVHEGDYDVRVPVVTSDELGELSRRLQPDGVRPRRARSRCARSSAPTSTRTSPDSSSPGNSRRKASRSTSRSCSSTCAASPPFAEQADPQEVVGALNALFETIVPLDRRARRTRRQVHGRRAAGGLRRAGEPRPTTPTARLQPASTSWRRSTRRRPCRVGVGINTGPVVAGSIGGAGRLNFSVIGDAVNVAARVESATRDTGDDLLITASTRDALVRPLQLVSRGIVALKGKRAPVEVLAAPTAAPAPAARTPGA